MAFKLKIIERKKLKRILKWIFEAHRVIVQKILYKQKDRAPPNYVGRIRSNLNLEVILKVKKAKNVNLQKKSRNRFWPFLAKLLVIKG